MLNLSQNKKYVVGILILALVIAYITWPKNNDRDTASKLTTEQQLLKQNAELMKQLIQEKDIRIKSLEDRIVGYNQQLEQNTLAKTNIIKQGNEKVTRVNTYTDDDILRYLSNLDSADIATPIPDSK